MFYTSRNNDEAMARCEEDRELAQTDYEPEYNSDNE